MIDFDYGVTLAPLDLGYKEMIRAWRNDPKIWRWCRQSDLISDQMQARWFESQDKDPQTKMYGILSLCNMGDELVGVCGLTDIDLINRRAEFSLYIAPAFQKRGLSKKALATLLDHGFKNLNLNSIWGETFEGNHALSVFHWLGFATEGNRHQFYFKGGRYIDAVLLSMTRDEWEIHNPFKKDRTACSITDSSLGRCSPPLSALQRGISGHVAPTGYPPVPSLHDSQV